DTTTYLNAFANRIDSLWVPDHLNGLFPRSLWKQKYCGATKLVQPSMRPWSRGQCSGTSPRAIERVACPSVQV
ncbi:MAG: luciferase family protein, partial [Mycobacterium sp.]|nr:luciferase family protein [Mycobacterium sp.]